MKTQIITLESHDDLISVRDRLSWAKTPRILLVWPKYEQVTLRLLDLKVLQRQADSLGAQLGLVTRRANVKRDAESLGIPVFKSATEAQKEVWPESTRRRRRGLRKPNRSLRAWRDFIRPKADAQNASLPARVATFAVGVLAVLAVAGLFVPRAAVTLYPESQEQAVVIPVIASESILSASLTGTVPAQSLSVVVSREQSLGVNSQITVPKAKAKGVAKFSNLSQSEVLIPAGTVLFTTGETAARFVTLQETRLGAGLDQSVEVPIEAVSPGTQGNVDAEQITAVEGQLGLSLAVTNPEPTSGGSDSKQVGASESDRARLSESLMENLAREAETQMREMLVDGDLLVMDTFEISQILTETFSPAEGQPGKELNLVMEVEFSARYVSFEDLNGLALASLDASLPADYETFAVPMLEPVNQPVTDDEGVTRFNLRATRTLLRHVDVPRVFSLTRGLAAVTARKQLNNTFPLREPPRIDLTPSWWPWMPMIPFNISVEVK